MRAARTTGRSKWFSVHRWLGLALGLWFALVGLTGAILVYEEPLDAWLNPDLLTARAGGAALTPDAIVARAGAEGLGHVERLRIPQAQREVYRLLVRTHPTRRIGNPRLEAMFDPASGALLGTRSAEKLAPSPRYALQTVYEFHRNVLLGETGSNIVGVAGFLLLVSAATGIVLAAPRNRSGWARLLAVNFRASATRVAFDLHRALGALVALLLLLATATGVTLVYTNYVRDLVNLVSRVQTFPVIPFHPSSEERLPLDRMLAEVRRAFPQQQVTEIRIPFGQMSGVQFYLRGPGDEFRLGDTLVWVHPASGEILVERSDRTRSGGETFMHWLYPLHSGTAFGAPGMAAMFAAGLAPLLLVATGLWVWLRKRRGERIAAANAAQRRAQRAQLGAVAANPARQRVRES